MNKIEKIKAEIERLQDATMDKNINFKSQYDQGIFDGLSLIDNFIDSLEEEPVSEDLEEAAHSYVDTTIECFDSDGNPCCYPAFIAGAQWQKKQDQSTIELAEDHAYLAGQEKIIDKACEFLEEHLLDFWTQKITNTDYFIEDFKKYMEE